MSAICRSCGAPIVWAKTSRGLSMPLDAAPVVDGNVAIRDGVAVVVDPGGLFDERPGEVRYVAHFATCPQAAQHRSRGRR